MLRLCRVIYPDSAVRVRRVARDSQKKATVLILGWGGARPRNLKKLEDYYAEEKGVSTVISFIMPLWAPGLVRQALVDEVAELAKTTSSNCTLGPIYVHSYSNNGAWVLADLMQRKQVAFKKIILDAAPWFVYEKLSLREESSLLSRVFVSILTRGNIFHPLWSPIVTSFLFVACSISRAAENFQSSIFTISRPLVPDLIGLSTYLRDSPELLTIPVLAVYSKDDKLIPPEVIEKFLNHQRSRGVQVESRIFVTGGHTGSFFLHSVAYKKLIQEFFEFSPEQP